MGVRACVRACVRVCVAVIHHAVFWCEVLEGISKDHFGIFHDGVLLTHGILPFTPLYLCLSLLGLLLSLLQTTNPSKSSCFSPTAGVSQKRAQVEM